MTVLPQPPTDREKLLYVNQQKTFLYSFGICSTLLLTIGGTLFAVHQPSFYWYFLFIFVNALYLGISYLIGFASRPFSHEAHWEVLRTGRRYKPSVDVFLPSAGEDLEILKNTYSHVWKLDWPTLNIYVLDDSGREEVRALAFAHGFTYISRPNKGEMKKAGNIRHAFALTKGEVILILDADFCPRQDFLYETVPYMADQEVAVVQTPQFFRITKDMPWIQKGASSIQELFYRLIQVNRNHFGASICVGTNALYRRRALEPFGGTFPIEHSEDVHTGFNLLRNGNKIKYIPLNLSSGICPETISAFFTQQGRWCTGSTSLFLNKELFWKTKLSLMQRLCFLSGMMYYQATGLGLILTPLPGILMVWFYPDYVFWYNTIFSLPSLIFGTLHMKLWNKQPYGLFAVRTRIISYYAHLFSLKDIVFGTVAPWVVTGDSKSISKQKRIRSFKRFMWFWTFVPAAAGLIGAAYHMTSLKDFNFYPYIAVTSFYFAVNISCLFEKKA